MPAQSYTVKGFGPAFTVSMAGDKVRISLRTGTLEQFTDFTVQQARELGLCIEQMAGQCERARRAG